MPSERAVPDEAPSAGEAEPERRRFLSRAAMAAGLAGGYGGFGLIAARFLYPTRPDRREWQYLMPVDQLRVGESLRYRSPAGETVNVTRRAEEGTAADFVALSSTCPHLGCQVHWESNNDRYFCPCHNGTFDPAGVATGGPPGDAGQSLPRYELRVEGNVLYIRVPVERLVAERPAGAVDAGDASGAGRWVAEPAPVSGPGHDPCLAGEMRLADAARPAEDPERNA